MILAFAALIFSAALAMLPSDPNPHTCHPGFGKAEDRDPSPAFAPTFAEASVGEKATAGKPERP